jgi:hypothetical protein
MGNYFQKKEEVQESDTVPANLVLIGAVMSGKRTQVRDASQIFTY